MKNVRFPQTTFSPVADGLKAAQVAQVRLMMFMVGLAVAMMNLSGLVLVLLANK